MIDNVLLIFNELNNISFPFFFSLRWHEFLLTRTILYFVVSMTGYWSSPVKMFCFVYTKVRKREELLIGHNSELMFHTPYSFDLVHNEFFYYYKLEITGYAILGT